MSGGDGVANLTAYRARRTFDGARERKHGWPMATKPPPDPEELGLWRRVGAYRDLLFEEIRQFETHVHPQCRSWRDWGMSEADVNVVARSAIDGVLAQLQKFDDQIRGLRASRDGNYALSKLKLVLEGHQNARLKTVHSVVVKWLTAGDDDSNKLIARAFLMFLARAIEAPSIPDIQRMLERAKDDPIAVDLDALDIEARAWCNLPGPSGGPSRYETPTNRALYIVARATGWSPDGDVGFSPDQVKRRLGKVRIT